MENLVTFNTASCVKKNDVVYLPLADVAYNLGFTIRTTRYNESQPLVVDNVFESIRWVRVQKYLKDIFESEAVKEEAKTNPLLAEDRRMVIEADYKPELISESVFYMLAMKANNERALKFQLWLSYNVIPPVFKYGFYVDPKWGDIPPSGKWTLATGEELRAEEIQERAKLKGCSNVENRRIQSLVDEIDRLNTEEGIKERYPYTDKDIQKMSKIGVGQEANWYECFIPEGANWDEYSHWSEKEIRYSEKFAELVRQIDAKFAEEEKTNAQAI